MAVEVPALDEARPVQDAAKPAADDVATSPAPVAPVASNESPPGSTTDPNKLLLSAAERFTLGMKKRTFSPTRTSFPSLPQTLSSPQGQATASPALQPEPERQQQQQSQQQQQRHQATIPEEQPSSSDNPFDFDFEFKNPFTSKRIHFGGYRRSLDSRQNSSIAHGSAQPTNVSMTEDESARMMQLKNVFNKFFKRKKDGKKGKGNDQVALEAEEYQLWNNLTPLVFQPSAVFMGLSFMIDDKGSALNDKTNVDWNMNIILALVKVRQTAFVIVYILCVCVLLVRIRLCVNV